MTESNSISEAVRMEEAKGGPTIRVLSGELVWTVEHGDCRVILASLPESSLDSCVCDPPYELGFMGRKWDGSGVAFEARTWREVLRVLKPGAHLAAFGGTRTVHRIACAIEDAGFEIRDGLIWHYASGFPKSKNLGGGVGTALKPSYEPIILARKPLDGTTEATFRKHGTGGLNIDACRVAHAGAADLAAHEAQVMAIKARGGSMAESWKNSSDLAGANDVSLAGRWPPNTIFSHAPACQKIGTVEIAANPTWDTPNRATAPSSFTGDEVSHVRHANDGTETVERWDCVDGCPVVELAAQSGVKTSGFMAAGTMRATRTGFSCGRMPQETSKDTPADTGTAARFFPQFEWTDLDDAAPFSYVAKAARSERDRGLDHFRARTGGETTDREDESPGTQSPRAGAGRNGGARNVHPTVKPVELLRWLIRLINPKGGVVADPFAGSGSCGMAAVLEGARYVGCELNDSEEEPFVSIARARISHVEGITIIPRASLRTAEPPRQRGLFDRTGTEGT